jgi:ubiquitin C-terminal hydrolase
MRFLILSTYFIQPKLLNEMGYLVKEFWNTKDGDIIDTRNIRSRLYYLDKKWMGHMQEDAHEFLTQIISALQEDFNRNATKPRYMELKDHENLKLQAVMEWKYSKQWNDSEVDDIFGFQIHNQVICPTCKYISNRFEYLTTLEVSLPRQSATIDASNSLVAIM